MKYRTGNPVGTDGSSDPRDMYDNAAYLDLISTSNTLTSVPDRLGQPRTTVHGYDVKANAAIDSMGMYRLVDKTFGGGTKITSNKQLLLWTTEEGGTGWHYYWTAEIPLGGKVIPPGSTPAGTGGEGPGGWLAWDDLEQRLAEGAAEVGGGRPSVSVNCIKALGSIRSPRADIQYHVSGFYQDSTIGGDPRVYVYDAARPRSQHTGGSVIAPPAILAWDGTPANLSVIINWTGTGNGCWVLMSGHEYAPEDFGAADTFESDNLATQKIIDVINQSGKAGVLQLNRYYKIDKIVFKNHINVRSLTDKCGFIWREQSNVNTWTGTVNVTQGSQTVTISGDVTSQIQAGNVFRKSTSAWLYIVLSATHSAGTTTVTLHRPYLQATESVACVTNIVYGMIEYNEGVTISVDIDRLDLDCATTNKGGFGVYRRAKAIAPSNVGGDWIGIWKKVRINQCYNGMWLRGTFSAPYNNSLEPNQFSEYQMLNIARTSTSDGAGLWLTGQVNQQTFIDPILQKYTPTSWSGVNVYIDMEPMATASGTSNKNPQGIRFLYPTIQGSEFGFLGYAGESIDIHNPYVEHIPKFINVEGYNISNQLDYTLTKPEFKGGTGILASPDGYFMRGGANTRIVLDGGIYKGSDNKWWVNAGGELIIDTPPLLVQGIGGYKDSFSDTLVKSVAFSSNKLILESQKVIFASAAATMDNIEADLWPGETLTVVAGNINGLIIRSGGNIQLPNGRSQLRLRQFQAVEFLRNDNPILDKDWILKEDRPRVDSRGASFTLDEVYANNIVRINQTTTVTIPSDDSVPGWAAGDTCILVFVSGATLTFTAESGVTIISAGGVLSTSTVGVVATLRKLGSNEWSLVFS